MERSDNRAFVRIIFGVFAGLITAAFFVFALSQQVNAQSTQDSAYAPRSFFSSALDKISGAVSHFRDAITGRVTVSNRTSETLAARKAVLTSVLEYLTEEAKQARGSLAALSISQDKKDEMAKILEENIFWFTSMTESITDARAVSQLKTVSDDISQYRDQRHAILTREISELAIAERQKTLIEVARIRTEQIEDDLASLEKKGKSTADFRASLATAREKIEKSSELLSEAIDILVSIHSPYEERKYRSTLEEAHQILSQSSVLLREAYKIFIAMADEVK